VKATWDTRDRIAPGYVEFKGAGISSQLARVKLNQNGALATPHNRSAAWYADGAAPGQRGPAVIVADTATVFARLHEARSGQKLRVVRVDGSQITYRVDEVTTVDASAFPSQEVYGQTVKPVLRLIGYDRASGRNVIVYAHAISMTTPPTRG
jgi:sortase (surface protein transpeptidase)